MGYEMYGLRDNPFPRGGAILKPQSSDPRENGSIFSFNARSREIHEFEEKYIGTKTSLDDRQRCGFLWAEGDRVSGRGMGKTALSVYMKHKINHDFGHDYFDNNTKFFCTYVAFSQQMVAKMGLFFQETLNSLIKDKIFHEASKCNLETLINGGVEPKFAEAASNDTVKDYLEKELDHSLDFRLTTRDWRVDPLLRDIFLNQATKCFKAAGFHGGILLIDDLENLTDKSTPRQVESFIKDFGIAFFRDNNDACNSSFYTIIFTAHQQSAQKMSQAWTVAGLSASYPLNPSGPASVLVRKPDLPQGLDMVKQYLNYFRSKSFSPPTEFSPFSEEAIENIVKESDYHPRIFLSRLNRVIVDALSKGAKDINADFVKTVPEIEDEEPPGIEVL